MTCTQPIYAVSIGKNAAHKERLVFYNKDRFIRDLKEKFGNNKVYMLPCGQCDACRSNYAHEWSIRCTLEALDHKHNYFITLTYDDKSILFAEDKDVNKFIDRLQKLDNKLKFFWCKEFGSNTSRRHYHMILFTDVDFGLYDPIKLGDFYHFHSRVIKDKWNFGLHDITPFECDCAAYVAKYVNKDFQPVFSRKEKRVHMSRNLGFGYFEKHFEEIINNNFKVYGQFGKKKYIEAPKCFLRWYSEKFGIDVSYYKDAKLDHQHNIVIDRMIQSGIVSEEDLLFFGSSLKSRKELRNYGL